MWHFGVKADGFNLLEMLTCDDGVFEETAGAACCGGVGEFGVAYGDYGAAHVGGCGVVADYCLQVGVVETRRRTCGKVEVYFGDDVAVACLRCLEDGVSVAELHHVVVKPAMAAGDGVDGVDACYVFACFDSVCADILHG